MLKYVQGTPGLSYQTTRWDKILDEIVKTEVYQVPRRRKHPLPTGHTHHEPFILGTYFLKNVLNGFVKRTARM
jgi:hypothetical protein